MDSLVGYGSDEEYDQIEYRRDHRRMALPGASSRRREDDTNYESVNMDMSEDSQDESEPELPQAEPYAPSPYEQNTYSQGNNQQAAYQEGRCPFPHHGPGCRAPINIRNVQRMLPNNRQDHRPSLNLRDDIRQSLNLRDDFRPPPNNRDDRRPSLNLRDDHPPSPNSREDRRPSPNIRDDNQTPPNNRDDRSSPEDLRVEARRRSPDRRVRNERDRRDRSPRKDDRRDDRKYYRPEGGRQDSGSSSRRGLLGDKPDEKSGDTNKVPALMDLKPFGGEPPPGLSKSLDIRDAVSPRFVDRDRREKDRERDRDRDRHGRRSEEKSRRSEKRSRSRERMDKPFDYSHQRNSQHRSRPNYGPGNDSNEKRSSPSGDFRPNTSYKVSKKLEVMEKMGLQIKTPDGSMATAQQLRQAAAEPKASLPYCNPAPNTTRMLDQVQKRKLLWANKTADKAPWTGTTFAQDDDGKQASKFMRLMGIKDPEAVAAPVPEKVDPNKKQEEMFQAMQAQYDVARATTHTMRGVGLGFQRGPF